MVIFDNVIKLIGRTPVVKINRLAPAGRDIYAKLEYFNPLSSVKDRLAIAVIEDAEAKGLLAPGQTVIEATSGNTGISLAMVCGVKGYPLVTVMSDSFSLERRQLMRSLGAKVVITPAASRATGMLKVAETLAKKNDWFYTNQFHNEANPIYHKNTTGPEILLDFVGKRLDYFVSGFGTGGTVSGAGAILKTARPDLKVILAEPDVASQLQGEPWASHKIQGWSPDFIPGTLDTKIADKLVTVTESDAISTVFKLAQQEGIFCGISGGATMSAAIKTAEEAPEGSAILAMVPDTAERYLSSALFANVSNGPENDIDVDVEEILK